MRRPQITVLAAALVYASFCSFAAADSPDGTAKFGRLPNGKAYRKDAQGYQLVDQIAELEVDNDALKRRVTQLEDELTGKGKTVPPTIQNRPIAPTAAPSCDAATEPLRNEIAKLTIQLKTETQSSGTIAEQHAALIQDAESLRTELAQTKQQLRNAPSAELVKSKDEQTTQLQSTIANLQRDLTEKDNRLSQLEKQVAAADVTLQKTTAGYEQELKLAHSEINRTTEKLSDLEEQNAKRASLSAPASGETEERTELAKSEPAPELKIESISSPEELSAARKKLTVYLTNIQGLILERKNIYDTLKSKSNNVSINLQPLKAKSGESLDALRARTQSINSGNDIATISSGLSDIEQVLRDDISVMKRVGHI